MNSNKAENKKAERTTVRPDPIAIHEYFEGEFAPKIGQTTINFRMKPSAMPDLLPGTTFSQSNETRSKIFRGESDLMKATKTETKFKLPSAVRSNASTNAQSIA